MRRRLHGALVGVVLCLTAGGLSPAEGNTDLQVIEAVVKAALEHQRKGAAVPWRNPETGNAGTVTMERSLFRGGKPCRQYTRTLERDGAVQGSVTGIGCRTKNGGWSLQEENGQAASGEQATGAASSQGTTTLAATPVALPSPSGSPVQAGETQFVNVWAYRTPPGRDRGDLFVKENVFSQELLETHPEEGALHVALLDGATIRLGANCQIKLDEFLYDPSSGAGKVTASMVRGVARFITGKVKGDSFQVRTPTALIGVRGTDFVVGVNADGSTVVHVIDGSVQMTLLRASIARLVNAGQTIGVRRDGASITTDVSTPDDPGIHEAGAGGGDEESGGEELRRRSQIPGVGAGSRNRVVQPPRRVAPAPPKIPKIGHH